MPKRKATKITERAGINYVQNVVESHNCIFHEVHNENDVGIDAFIEFVKGEDVTGKLISIQVKSGKSFIDKGKNEIKLPISHHREYWLNHSLPVIGIVYDPEDEIAYWCDIKTYLEEQDESKKNIICKIQKHNLFNKEDFMRIFVSHIFRDYPDLSFEECVEYINTKDKDDIFFGLRVIHQKYLNTKEAWEELFKYFNKNSSDWIHPDLFDIFSELNPIDWRYDLVYSKAKDPEVKEYARELLRKFKKNDVCKLLYLVGEPDPFRDWEQSAALTAERVIQLIPEAASTLKEIMHDQKQSNEIRELAAIIYIRLVQDAGVEEFRKAATKIHFTFIEPERYLNHCQYEQV